MFCLVLIVLILVSGFRLLFGYLGITVYGFLCLGIVVFVCLGLVVFVWLVDFAFRFCLFVCIYFWDVLFCLLFVSLRVPCWFVWFWVLSCWCFVVGGFASLPKFGFVLGFG